METLVRALAIFLFCMLVFRFSGKRTLQDISLFDFVMLLIISEATQQALLDEDFSLINGFLVIAAYVLVDIGLSLLKRNSPKIEKALDGIAILIVINGEPQKKLMEKSRVDEEDILAAARELQGIERMDQIKYAILEKNGAITIVPN